MRPWRAGGDGRPVAFPVIPWHKDLPTPPKHDTEIVHQPPLEGWMASHPGLYYYSCVCGVAGLGHSTRAAAVSDADAHLEAAP